MCQECWQAKRLSDILAQKPFMNPAMLKEIYPKADVTGLSLKDREKILNQIKDYESTKEVREKVRPKYGEHSRYLCPGSNTRGVQLLIEESGVSIGRCRHCDKLVIMYLDLGTHLCVEHLSKPLDNPCGECGESVWDDDYLCPSCRKAQS